MKWLVHLFANHCLTPADCLAIAFAGGLLSQGFDNGAPAWFLFVGLIIYVIIWDYVSGWLQAWLGNYHE